MPAPVGRVTSFPRLKKRSSKKTKTMPSQENPNATSAHSDAASSSHKKADSPTTTKKPWRQRLKTFLVPGYPPTYQYDIEHGKHRPEYGVFDTGPLAEKRTSKL